MPFFSRGRRDPDAPVPRPRRWRLFGRRRQRAEPEQAGIDLDGNPLYPEPTETEEGLGWDDDFDGRYSQGGASAVPIDEDAEDGGIIGYHIEEEEEETDDEEPRELDIDELPIVSGTLLTPETSVYETRSLTELIAFVESNVLGFTDIVRILWGMEIDEPERKKVGGAMIEIWDSASNPPERVMKPWPVYGDNKFAYPNGVIHNRAGSFATHNPQLLDSIQYLQRQPNTALVFRLRRIASVLDRDGTIAPTEAYVMDWDNRVIFVGAQYKTPVAPSYHTALEEGASVEGAAAAAAAAEAEQEGYSTPPPQYSPGRNTVSREARDRIRRQHYSIAHMLHNLNETPETML